MLFVTFILFLMDFGDDYYEATVYGLLDSKLNPKGAVEIPKFVISIYQEHLPPCGVTQMAGGSGFVRDGTQADEWDSE